MDHKLHPGYLWDVITPPWPAVCSIGEFGRREGVGVGRLGGGGEGGGGGGGGGGGRGGGS